MSLISMSLVLVQQNRSLDRVNRDLDDTIVQLTKANRLDREAKQAAAYRATGQWDKYFPLQELVLAQMADQVGETQCRKARRASPSRKNLPCARAVGGCPADVADVL